MSVPVARADADQHRARGHRLQELGRAVPGTVVPRVLPSYTVFRMAPTTGEVVALYARITIDKSG
ncbi:MAG: hypothetical protein K0R87_2480, partial [Pseudonocardia sp.]|nr:hypothetical protein [Pseudonocardia sp.]